MFKLILILFIFQILFSKTIFSQTEKEEIVMLPVSSIGEVSETRKMILQNTLTKVLSKHYKIITQEKLEAVTEKVFQELEYEECTEDRCLVMIQDILQIENLFQLQLIGEEGDTQINLRLITLDEKINEEIYCEGCKTRDLRQSIESLVKTILSRIKPKVIVEKSVLDLKIDDIKKELKKEKQIISTIDKEIGNFIALDSNGYVYKTKNGFKWEKIIYGVDKGAFSRTNIKKLIYGNGTYIVYGNNGTILKSVNGYSWELVTIGHEFHINDVIFNNKQFISVGNNETIMISNNGLEWKTLTNGSVNLHKIKYLNNNYYAVGDQGIIYFSNDGKNWKHKNPINLDLLDIVYNENGFVALGKSTILHSNNFNDWEIVYKINGKFKQIIQNPFIQYIAVGGKGTILESNNGKDWKKINLNLSDGINSIAYNDSFILAVGDNGIVLKSDYKNWKLVKRFNVNLYNLKYNDKNKLFSAYSSDGRIIYSYDGIKWGKSKSNYGVISDVNIYKNKTSFNVIKSGEIYYSNDLNHWYSSMGNNKLKKLINNSDKIFAFDDDNKIFHSTGTKTWEPFLKEDLIEKSQKNDYLRKFNSVVSSENINLAIGDNGIIFRSNDSKKWENIKIDYDINLNAIINNNDIYVIVGDDGTIITSKDGIDWVTKYSGTDDDLIDIIFGNDEFVVLGEDGNIVVSKDGISWDKYDYSDILGFNDDFNSIAYGSGYYVLVGDSGIILYSKSTKSFQKANTNTELDINSVSYGNNKFIAVGDDGIILTSPKGGGWNLNDSLFEDDLINVVFSK